MWHVTCLPYICWLRLVSASVSNSTRYLGFSSCIPIVNRDDAPWLSKILRLRKLKHVDLRGYKRYKLNETDRRLGFTVGLAKTVTLIATVTSLSPSHCFQVRCDEEDYERMAGFVVYCKITHTAQQTATHFSTPDALWPRMGWLRLVGSLKL